MSMLIFSALVQVSHLDGKPPQISEFLNGLLLQRLRDPCQTTSTSTEPLKLAKSKTVQKSLTKDSLDVNLMELLHCGWEEADPDLSNPGANLEQLQWKGFYPTEQNVALAVHFWSSPRCCFSALQQSRSENKSKAT